VTNRPYAVFDIDGTLVRWQLFHAVADALIRLGYVEAEAFASMRAARMAWKRRDDRQAFKAYEQQLVKTYNQLLSQLRIAQFDEAAEAVFSEYKDQVYIYTRDIITSLKAKGYLLFAISNSQAEIIEKIAAYWGFDDFVGAVYERRGDHFSGHVTVHLHDKDVVLRQLVSKHGALQKGSIAIGDSASDIPMLEATEQAIAFNPDQILFEHAKSKEWQIVIERKNVIYKLGASHGRYLLA